MALPMMAPAATPPITPAPTAQPKQPALAGAGAANALSAMPAAAASPMTDLCMRSPQAIGRVPISADVGQESPCNPRFHAAPRHAWMDSIEKAVFGGSLMGSVVNHANGAAFCGNAAPSVTQL